MDKLRKQTGQKIDPNSKNGKSDKCDKMAISAKMGNGKLDRARGMLNVLKQAGPQIEEVCYW